MRPTLIALVASLASFAVPAVSQTTQPDVTRLSVVTSVRPDIRPAVPEVRVAVRQDGFQTWLSAFFDRARAQGISNTTLQSAFSGIRYDGDVVARDRNQSEFTKTLWQYLDSAVSDARIRNGRAALRDNGRTLQAIEDRYGVDKEVVAAIWGLESAYGEYRGSTDVIEALATLAYDGRRGRFFEQQLIAALKIIQNGDVSARNMTGSWAGAMGHTQFIPTSYEAYAVDFTGDGKRDIWSDDPTDALASTAAYLSRFGWREGHPWGIEVALPQGFDYSRAGKSTERSVASWRQMGLRTADGGQVPDYGDAALILPAGAQGPAMLIFHNFGVIERYNAADSYVIGVGHLSDRLRGGGSFRASWPDDARRLRRAERVELQRRLTAAGFSTQGVDGMIGPNTRAAIRRYQTASGMTPDGYASLDLLQQLR